MEAAALAAALCGALALCSCADPGGFRDASPPPPAEPPVSGLEAGRAVLARGPDRARGVPGFGANALPALRAEYAVASGADRLAVVAYFTREALAPEPGWIAPAVPAAPGFSLLSLEGGERTLWLARARDYGLVVVMPAGMEGEGAFLGAFLERFDYFYRFAAREEDLSFPAAVDYGR